ncbi:MAG: hypothetical protein JSS54_17800 [Proteobacteria bacterium]|nr:hypothetical protein [Pseudomonadota bacterium]
MQNQDRFEARGRSARASFEPAAFAISADGFRTPFAAGLLLGWGETGNRPEFSAVTAVGFGALIAPFAFVGGTADDKLADVFTCNAASWTEIAQHAAGLIDEAIIQAIARKYSEGGELLVALPGSAARPETVWNVGAIAASNRADARKIIGDILVASISLDSFVDPKSYPKSFGIIAERNFTFRKIGAGDPFLLPERRKSRIASYFLLDGNTASPAEGAQYIAEREAHQRQDTKHAWTPLITAFDFKQVAEEERSLFKFAMAPYQPSYEVVPAKAFDMDFTRTLFRKSYWKGMHGEGWQSTLPGQARASE